MESKLQLFENIARKILAPPPEEAEPSLHPFVERNIHPEIQKLVKKLFDDGHHSQATFEAFKFIDKTVGRHAKSPEFGYELMMDAFKEVAPKIALNALVTKTEKSEQQGFKWLFVGGALAIRNPRGHYYIVDDEGVNRTV